MNKRKYKKNLSRCIKDICKRKDFISSKYALVLEDYICYKYGCLHSVTCANGTDAIKIALRCFDLKKDDIVLVPDYTFFSTAEVVSLCGGEPYFVDIDQETFQMDLSLAEMKIKELCLKGKCVRGIISVDIFGSLVDYKKIREICDNYELFFISDAAQSFGVKFEGNPTTNYADITCSSFHPTKVLGACGDAGICMTNDKEFYFRMKSLTNHGIHERKYVHYEIGYSSRMDEIQAAIVFNKYKFLYDYDIEERRRKWLFLKAQFEPLGEVQKINYSSFYCFSILCTDTSMQEARNLCEVEKYVTLDNYIPLHSMPVYRDKYFDNQSKSLEISKKILVIYIETC